MKISIITSPFGTIPPTGIGAVEKLWYDMFQEFKKNKFNCNIYCKKDPLNLEIHDKDIFQIKGFERSGNIFFDLILDFIYTFRVFKKLTKTDILVVNTFFSPIIARFFSYKFRKLIYNVQRIPKGQFFLYQNVDNFICPSSIVKEKLKKELSVAENISTIIGNPVNGEVYVPYKLTNKVVSDKFEVLYFGRIHPEKGIHILVDSLKIVSSMGYNVNLKLIGPYKKSDGGGGENYFNNLLKIFKNTIYLEPISNPKQLYNEIKKCDIFCYPSLAEEGETFGVSIMEAMSSGRPIIVSNLMCFNDFVIDKKNGFIFNHKSAEKANILAEIIIKFINDNKLREKLSHEAVKTSINYNNQNIAKKHLINFKNVLNE